MGMCCKGKNKQGQYRPWECVVKEKTNKGNTDHGNVLKRKKQTRAIQTMGICYKGKNKQGQYRPWECVVKVKTNKGNTDHGNVL
jgi:hypothetical protein